MMDIVVTEDNVLIKLLALEKSKSPGPDGIHLHMLMEVAHAVKVPLSIIFKNSIHGSTIPTTLMEGNIVPILRNGC